MGRVEATQGCTECWRSHSVRKPAYTTTGADRMWPQRDTVVHSGRPSSSWSLQSAALPDWSCIGAQRLGKTATPVSSGGLGLM